MSNNIVFTSIYGKNFQSYSEFDLPIVSGKHLIVGANGQGKSTLIEGLPYTIYKKYLRGDNPSKNGKGNCLTGAKFSIGQNEYEIGRYHKDKKNKSNSFIIKNGKDVSSRLSGDTDKEIEKIIGIPYDLFVSTCTIIQGLPVNFSQFTPTIRKSIIEDIINFNVWDDYKEKFKLKLKELEELKHELSKKYDKINYDMISLNSKIETLKESQLDVEKVAIEKSNEINQELISLMNPLDNAKKLLNEGEDKIALNNSYQAMSSAVTITTQKINDLNIIVNQQICPTCDRPYPETEIAQAKKQYDRFQKKHTILNDNLRELQTKINNVNQIENDIFKLETQINSKKGELAGVKQALASSKMNNQLNNTDKLEDQLASLNEQINFVNVDVEGFEKEIGSVEYLITLLQPSSTFRTEILVSYIEKINLVIAKIVPLIFNNISVSLTIDKRATGVDIAVVRDGKKVKYKSLSGGEKRRLDIILIFAFQRFLLSASGVRSNLVVMDEIMDGLDANGIDSIVNCMDMVFPKDTAVYIISHDEQVKDRFDSVIKVWKDTDGNSYLEQK